ncbi:MAG: hypothetical protein QW774_04195 [Candidatus Micrarchaeaceae archaeon]
MRKYSLFIAVSILMLAATANAQYWFQTGARAGSAAAQNNGASITIQTVKQPIPASGSLGFWVGETIQNGAFLQAGYVIENQSGYYPSLCTQSGCSSHEYINAGDAEWFYEYFPPNYNGGFLGALGPDNSAGTNGTFNTYSFYSIGNTWYFLFNGKVVGSADLGASSSGSLSPVAFAEVANTSTSSVQVNPVLFSNFSAYKDGRFMSVSKGYAYVGYGVGSEKMLKNPYGVKEVDNRINYFEVGSGLPQPENGTLLWSLGYALRTISQYGNISGTVEYAAYSQVQISAPSVVQISNGKRALFLGWVGTGYGSYTGPANTTTISLDSNITEEAEWATQYYLNVSSAYSNTTGSGWYNNGTILQYGTKSTTVYQNATSRFVFAGWSNGNANATGIIKITGPTTLEAIWQHEFYVNATSSYQYIGTYGSGWYNTGTLITLYPMKTIENVSGTERYAFVGWNNGNDSPTIHLVVESPVSIEAIFSKQVLVSLTAANAGGNPISVSRFYINGKETGSKVFVSSNESYEITGAYYNGVQIPLSQQFTASAPSTIQVQLPVYPITIVVHDAFGSPISTNVTLQFSNYSIETLTTNSSGVATVENVPYGYSKGYAKYLGIDYPIATSAGATSATITVFSAYNIAEILAVIIIIAIAYFASKRHFRSSGIKPQ